MRMNSSQIEVLKIDGKNLKDVQNFTYLGTKISENKNTLTEINKILMNARRIFGSLSMPWKSNEIAVKKQN